jgi:hypothetical protein
MPDTLPPFKVRIRGIWRKWLPFYFAGRRYKWFPDSEQSCIASLLLKRLSEAAKVQDMDRVQEIYVESMNHFGVCCRGLHRDFPRILDDINTREIINGLVAECSTLHRHRTS